MLQRASSEAKRAELELELACPAMPAAAEYIWNIFARLARRRGSNGFGPCPLTWPDMDAFQRISGFRLTPWEVEVIEMLDELWLASLAPKKA